MMSAHTHLETTSLLRLLPYTCTGLTLKYPSTGDSAHALASRHARATNPTNLATCRRTYITHAISPQRPQPQDLAANKLACTRKLNSLRHDPHAAPTDARPHSMAAQLLGRCCCSLPAPRGRLNHHQPAAIKISAHKNMAIQPI